MREPILRWKCDRCGSTGEVAGSSTSPLLEVNISINFTSYGEREKWDRPHWTMQDWCFPCAIKVGIIVKREERAAEHQGTPISNAPSIEDMIREIAREEVNNR